MTIAYRLLAYIALALTILVAGFAAGHHVAYVSGSARLSALQEKDAKAIAKQETVLAKNQADALAKQQADEQHLAVIQQTHEEDMAHAKAQYAANLASLRSGNLRLRSEWNTCEATSASNVSQTSSGGTSASDAAQLRYEDASHLVLYADQADAEIRALQAIVIQDRK